MDLTTETDTVAGGDKSENGALSLLLAISLTTLAALALEIALTRLFSVLYFPPAVFGILSLAILGIGIGAALVTWHSRLQNVANMPLYLQFAAASTVCIVLAATVPALQPALFGLVVLPYLFIGMTLTTIFSARPQQSNQFYMADLLGAGLGALAAVPLLNWLGSINAILCTAVFLSLAGLILNRGLLSKRNLFAFFVTLFLLVGNLIFSWLAIDMNHLPVEKPVTSNLDHTGNGDTVTQKFIATRWDAFARSDLIDPGDGSPYRLYIDGAAGSVMPPAADNEFLWNDIGFFPFATEQPQRVFIIGPGAGLDVWFALQSGAEEIVGVEVNPASVQLVREYADYNGNLYHNPNVSIEVDDGRSVLQRDEKRYDLIFLSQLVTLAAERNGYALAENSSFTVEAFINYLDHLTPNGQIGVKLYDEPTLTRALSTALEAFRQQGLTDQEGLQHMIALLDGSAQPPIPLLVISKKAFTRDDSLSLGAVAQQVGFTPLFLPEVLAQPPLDAVAEGRELFSAILAEADNDLSPPTDDRPFFYQFERGIPQALRQLLLGVLIVLLLGTVLVWLHQQREAIGRWSVASPLYFAGLGLGFILLEIGVIQQTRLFLGHPTIAITAVLAILLISGGIGSGFAGRWFGDKRTLSKQPILAVIVILVLWLVMWPFLQNQFFAAQSLIRILVVMAGLIPLGLVMGMPFPLGLRAVAGHGRRQVPLAWMVNGIMSVAGSVLAVTMAVLFGYSIVIIAGGLAYGLALLAALLISSRDS
ncbi:MAG: hypothetical protein R3293_21050 [Candidatus Promineifilaceae bacterium]|nr:hypothetical protein [Candidatus Promineifilaceae bacterium]